MPARKIAIVGIGASGKSTLAGRLAARTGLPVFYLDNVFWCGDWERVPEPEYLREHAALVRGESWIIEGFVEPKMAERLSAADVVLYLDYGRWRCAGRLIRRWIRHRGQVRPELRIGARERINPSFLRLVFTRGERPYIEAAIAASQPPVLRRFRSPRALERYLVGDIE